MTPAELYREFPPPAMLRRQLGLDRSGAQEASMAGEAMMGDSARAAAARDVPPEIRRELQRRGPQRIVADLVGAKLVRAIQSERQLEELMTDFWFNHFNVFLNKNQVRYLTSDYEREAIRPHVFGTFGEMLLATARHPAMLVYLDNWTSVAPDSLRRGRAVAAGPRAGNRMGGQDRLTPAQRDRMGRNARTTRDPARRAEEMQRRMRERPPAPAARPQQRRERGINENYARELLELHTLGVDGGYTQEDVVALARILTGWTMTGPGQGARMGMPASGGARFVFRPQMHDQGEKTLLGRRFAAGRGEEEGWEALHMLATHPATARHIATKLAERFVADDPPQALVDRLTAIFVATGGDLRALTRTLFTAPEFYDPAVVRAKVKTPFHFVASALRAGGAEMPRVSRTLTQALRTFGHMPYMETAPTGYPVTKEEWVNSGAMLGRMNFALQLGAGRVDGVRFAPALEPGADVAAALSTLFLPGSDTRALQALVREELARTPEAPPQQRIARAAGLILGSPEFQRY